MPAICSSGPARVCPLFQKLILSLCVNGGVPHPTPAFCRDPGQAAQSVIQVRKLKSTPAEVSGSGFCHWLQKDFILRGGSACYEVYLNWTELSISPESSTAATCLRTLLKWLLCPQTSAFSYVYTLSLGSPRGSRVPSLRELALHRELCWTRQGVGSPAEHPPSLPPVASRALQADGSYKNLWLKPLFHGFMALSRGLSLKDYLGGWLSVKHAVPAMFSCLGQIPFVGVRRRSSSSGVTWIPISTGSDTFLSSAREEGGGLLLSMLFS